MDKSPVIPHAPSEPLPELVEFLKPFQALFRRRESQPAMERYLTGLLTEHPAKNCDTLAEIGLHLLDQANAWGVRHACVVADAAYRVGCAPSSWAFAAGGSMAMAHGMSAG